MKYSLRKMFQQTRGNFGHKGRPGMVGGSSKVGGHSEDMMSDAEVISETRDVFKKWKDKTNQWSIRDSIMNLSNKYLGKDYVSLGGPTGKFTASTLAEQLSNLPDDVLLEIYNNDYGQLL